MPRNGGGGGGGDGTPRPPWLTVQRSMTGTCPPVGDRLPVSDRSRHCTHLKGGCRAGSCRGRVQAGGRTKCWKSPWSSISEAMLPTCEPHNNHDPRARAVWRYYFSPALPAHVCGVVGWCFVNVVSRSSSGVWWCSQWSASCSRQSRLSSSGRRPAAGHTSRSDMR